MRCPPRLAYHLFFLKLGDIATLKKLDTEKPTCRTEFGKGTFITQARQALHESEYSGSRPGFPLDDVSGAPMAITALLLKYQNRNRSVGICKNLGHLRFQYASSISCYASHDAATMKLRFWLA